MVWDLSDRVALRDVGPRDGLQAELPVTVADRLGLIAALVDAGAADVEAAAFGSGPGPGTPGAADLFRAIERDEHVRYWALVADATAAEQAVDAGVDALTVAVSASEAHSQRSLKLPVEAAVARIGPIADRAGGRPLDVVVTCSFGSPDGDEVGAFDVAAVVDGALDAGATSITLADTTGTATPDRIADVVATAGVEVRLRLRDTRGTALVNAFAAMTLGVTAFDTAVGGIGGSPFAGGAGGNLATEDLVHLCDGLGVDTGVDLGRMVRTARTVSNLIGRPVPSRITAVLGR